MPNSKGSDALKLAIAAVLYGVAASARASGAGSSVRTEASSSLQEVVVTATRRSTSVLDVPYNIQAITGQDLAMSGVSSPDDLTRMSPDLSVFNEGPRTSGDRNTFNMRGLNAENAYNNDDNPSLNGPAVSTYFGEVPVFFPFKLVDMSRVEILRGPQGTLYGDSSIGGTIRFIPNAPDPHRFTIDADADTSYTEHADKPSYDGSFTVNVPLSSTSAFRATVGDQYLSGFVDAVDLVRQTGTALHPGAVILQNPADILNSPAAIAPAIKDYNSAVIDVGRASLLWSINDRLKVTFNTVYQENDAKGRYEDNPYYGTYQNYKYYTAFTDPQIAIMKLFDADVTVDLGFAQMTAVSGLSDLYTDGISDSSGFLRTHLSSYYFGYPRLFAPIYRDQYVDTYTEEVRLVSKNTKTVDWIVGAYYQNTHNTFHLRQDVPGINAYTNAALGTVSPIDFTDTLSLGYTATTFQDVAGYGEITWHATNRWQVTGGARIFRDTLGGISGVPLPYASLTTQYLVTGVANNPYYLGGYIHLSSRDTDHIFKINTAYELNEDTRAYLTVSQGFRAGGANPLPATDPLGDDNRPYLLYRPDTDTNYEIGLKGDLRKRFTYTLTAFWVDWKDFQATLYTPFGVNYIANVNLARSDGVELEFAGRLTNRLSFGLGYSYTDAQVARSFLMQAGQPSTLVPVGSPLPGSSKNSGSAFIQYAYPVGGGALLFRADTSYRGPSQSNFNNIPSLATNNFVRFSSVSISGASVTWEQDRYSVGLYGENLSNSRGTSEATSAAFYGPRDQGYGVIRPRTVGLRFSYSYP
jgi:iron complex outermembrane receptor protein